MSNAINSFEKGLNTDAAPERQEKNTYRYLLNGVDSSDSGDRFKITTELGTTVYCSNLPTGIILGQTTLNTDIILFNVNGSAGDVGYSCEIGIVDYTGLYTTKVSSLDFNFNSDYPIQAVARIGFNGYRIVYFVDDLNVIRRVDLDSTDVFDIGNTYLNSNITLPIINFLKFNENHSGQLLTGIYQFVARYLQDDLSPTVFGFICNPIPVVVPLMSVGRDQYDGASVPEFDAPVTNKTIELSLSNLDTSKKTLELVYIRFNGLGEQIQIKSFAKIPITSSSMNLEFTGLEQTTDVTIEEVVQDQIAYTTAKTIVQKDNRLLLGNLKSRKEDVLQAVANQIKVTYDIEVHDYPTDQSVFDDYKGELQTFNKKTYMSEEVYALSLQALYIDGTRSFAYHIPAEIPASYWVSADSYTTTFPNGYDPTMTTLGQKWYPPIFNSQTDGVSAQTNLKLGTYISTEKYEPNKGYPTTGTQDAQGNVFIRHHLMPPLDVEPHFLGDGTYEKIRYKALRFTIPDFSILDPALVKDIVGYVIMRADRTLENRSIVAQGLIQRNVKNITLYDNSGPSDAGDPSPYPTIGQEFYTEAPGFSNILLDVPGVIISSIPGFRTRKKYTVQSFPYPPFFGYPPQNRAYSLTASSFSDIYNFYSPDFILGNTPLSPVNVKEKLLLRGTTVNFKSTDKDGTYHTGSEDDFAWSFFCNYNNLTSKINNKYGVGASYYFQNSAQNTDTNYSFANPPVRMYENFTTPHYTFKLNSGTLYQDTNYFNIHLNLTSGILASQYDNCRATPDVNSGLTNTKALTNFQNTLVAQYSTLGNLEYLPIAIVPDKNALPPELDGGNNQIKCFNGDIFISKFYFKNSTLAPLEVFATNNQVFSDPVTHDIDAFPPYKGVPFQSGSYFFVESVVNSNYRHQVPAIPPSVTAGEPYYPKTDIATVLNTDPIYGNSTGYNLLYSYNNTIKLIPERPFGFISVGEFPNRIIYSEESIESEQLDAYKKILANSFHDIPKNKGEIWNLFVWNGTLYAHCPKTLWRTFTNEQTALVGAYDGGAIQTGSGGMFPRQSIETITISGGFAGTISQFGGYGTPQGYIFPDILQGKMFRLSQQLEEISGDISIDLNNTLKSYINPITKKFIDNPYKPGSKGIIAVYDSYKDRYIFTNHDDANTFTLTHSANIDGWRSYMSYQPNLFIANNNDFFAISNGDGKVHKHNSGPYLQFYGNTPSPFQIDFVVNSEGFANIPDNLQIKGFCTDRITDNYVHQRQFDKIRVYNKKMNSDIIPIITDNTFGLTVARNQIKAVEKNDSYRLTFPKNLVLDDSKNIFDFSNLVSNLPLTDVGWLFRPRIKGDYAIVQLTHLQDPSEDLKFTLNFIKVSDRANQFE